MNTLKLEQFDTETQDAITAVFEETQSNGNRAGDLIQTQAGIALVIAKLEEFYEGDTDAILELLNKYSKDPIADFRGEFNEVIYKFYEDGSMSYENHSERYLEIESENWFAANGIDEDSEDYDEDSADAQAQRYSNSLEPRDLNRAQIALEQIEDGTSYRDAEGIEARFGDDDFILFDDDSVMVSPGNEPVIFGDSSDAISEYSTAFEGADDDSGYAAFCEYLSKQ
jgi:hypothetical protein